ncbi:hypothetical protein GUJ93_ZPchr0006g44020 [Zizania palustris]|uniref:Uncharacterized protein n=1 Tax=Zizania palustris TaxID=103762 RepID=A0A8J5TC71_ZIZPA|nr:hypothetical protein GUJ93_ZPchr0006g44020 [Zizania palustris]
MEGSAETSVAAAADDVELLKAVAQAWHAQSGNLRPPSRAGSGHGADYDGAGASGARRAGTSRRPSRFKLEAAAARRARAPWDFAQSLWDTYELVAVARKLESGLVLADHAGAAPRAGAQELATTTRLAGRAGKRVRESSRRLKSMFLRSSPRRFEESSS